jgi:uncharacterized lipoprotein YmbA
MRFVMARLSLVALIFGVVEMAGCFRSPSPHFYSLVSQERVASAAQLAPDGVSVEVAPLIFPQYLDDPRIVVRSGPHEVLKDEYERWIEDLDLNFRRVLLSDLSRHLKSGNVFSSDLYGQRSAAQVVQVEVLQFDVSDDNKAVLKARWAAARSREALNTATLTVSQFEGQAASGSSEARVSALSELIDAFSHEVAQKVAAQG